MVKVKLFWAGIWGRRVLSYPDNDPNKSPGEGNWYNPTTGEMYHPDLNHPELIDPRWDYTSPEVIEFRHHKFKYCTYKITRR